MHSGENIAVFVYSSSTPFTVWEKEVLAWSIELFTIARESKEHWIPFSSWTYGLKRWSDVISTGFLVRPVCCTEEPSVQLFQNITSCCKIVVHSLLYVLNASKLPNYSDYLLYLGRIWTATRVLLYPYPSMPELFLIVAFIEIYIKEGRNSCTKLAFQFSVWSNMCSWRHPLTYTFKFWAAIT